jgi:hypothetical protein
LIPVMHADGAGNGADGVHDFLIGPRGSLVAQVPRDLDDPGGRAFLDFGLAVDNRWGR